MKAIGREQYWTYFLLAARILLAYTLTNYGWAKLTGNQFGVDARTMNLPLKDVDLFRLSWYLADHQPFKAFVGVSQIVAGLLLLINRTVIIGAFFSVPIWLNILMWDLTFMEGFTTAFPFRLSFYLVLTFLIVYREKNQVVPALWSMTTKRPGYTYPVWVYLTLPAAAIGLEVVGALLNALLYSLKFLTK
jgi:uncharacterized membrane protein YphA (DoxX/SURF4 family)